KPVPVNSRNLRKPKEDMFWIALAGPLSNILLAMIGTVLFVAVAVWDPGANTASFLYQTKQAAGPMLDFFIGINLVLAFFNLIPLHPLDGGKVLARFLP